MFHTSLIEWGNTVSNFKQLMATRHKYTEHFTRNPNTQHYIDNIDNDTRVGTATT